MQRVVDCNNVRRPHSVDHRRRFFNCKEISVRAHPLVVPTNQSSASRASNAWFTSSQPPFHSSQDSLSSIKECQRLCRGYLERGGDDCREERTANLLAVIAWSDYTLRQNDGANLAAVTEAAGLYFCAAAVDDLRAQTMTEAQVRSITHYIGQQHQIGATASREVVEFVRSILNDAGGLTLDASLLLNSIADHLADTSEVRGLAPAEVMLRCAVFAMAKLVASKVDALLMSPGVDDLNKIEFPIRRFSDGSVRPDRLIAPALTHSGITHSSGRPVRGNHFSLPQFIMKNSMSNEAHTDSHMHLTNYVQQGLTLERVLDMMDEIGIRSSTLMPIPTSLQVINGGRSAIDLLALARDTAGETSISTELEAFQDCGLESYYVPKDIQEREMRHNGGKPLSIADFRKTPGLIKEIVQRGELYLDTSVNSHLASQIRLAGLSAAQRSRLDPMVTGINLGDLRGGTKLLTELYHNKGVFTGIGEITVHKEIVEQMYAGQRGQANVHSRSDGLVNLLEMAGVVGMPAVLHCDIDNLHEQIARARRPAERDDTPVNLNGLRQIFTNPRLKDTAIIWAHGGGLGRFVLQGPNHLALLSTLLRECPNLYLDISWSEVAKQINCPGVKTDWAHFLERNSTHICFGSDTLAPGTTKQWNETKSIYADIFSRLSPAAKGNILNHTYEHVIVGARAKVRQFESKILTAAFYEKYLINPHAEQPLSAYTVRAEFAA